MVTEVIKSTKVDVKNEKLVSIRAARKAGAEVGRKQKSTYLRIKSFALEREKKNYSKLFIIHEKKNWWKMIGHSAVLYHYEISKKVGLHSKLVPDSDYDFCSEEGIVNVRDIELLNEKLIANKISPLEITSEYRIYNIGKKYTAADLRALKRTKALEWAKVNKIVLPKEIFPSVYANLRELLRKVYFSTRSFDQYIRVTVAEPMLERVVGLLREYSLLSNGVGLTAAGFTEEVEQNMRWISAQMIVIEELNLMTPEKIFQILRITESIRREIEKCRPKKI